MRPRNGQNRKEISVVYRGVCMLQFLCGLLIGGIMGVFVMALMVAARDDG